MSKKTGKPTVVVYTRVDDHTLAAITRKQEAMQRANPSVNVSQSAAVRELLREGLAADASRLVRS